MNARFLLDRRAEASTGIGHSTRRIKRVGVDTALGACHRYTHASLIRRPLLRGVDELPSNSAAACRLARYERGDVGHGSGPVEHGEFGKRHQAELGAAP